ncbi:MAG: hypothetical protein ACWA5Q_04000 [bacterium]
MKDSLIGKCFEISGMTLEIVAEADDRWETRNITTQGTVFLDKAVLDRAIRLGQAEEVSPS